MAATAGPSRSPVADPSQDVATTGSRANIDGTLDSAFTLLLQKSLQAEQEQVVRPANVIFPWTGGGQPLTQPTMDPIIAEIPFPCRLVWVHMWAGDAQGLPVPVSATIELQVTNIFAFGASLPLYGTGVLPTMDNVFAADLDLTDWNMNLATGDTIIAYPLTFSGSATWLSITMQLRPSEQAIGVSDVVDNAGDNMTFNDGSPMEIRA